MEHFRTEPTERRVQARNLRNGEEKIDETPRCNLYFVLRCVVGRWAMSKLQHMLLHQWIGKWWLHPVALPRKLGLLLITHCRGQLRDTAFT